MNPSRSVLLHIGGMKTGTTSLQLTLGLNRTSLEAQSVLYSRVAGEQEHRLLLLYATQGASAPDLRHESGLSDDADFAAFLAGFPEALTREVEESNCRVLIFSSEHLSSRVRRVEEVERLWHLLRRFATDIRVVYYARPQLELPFSIWSTMLKSGSVAPFDVGRIISNQALDHAGVVARWGACCADRDWILRPFQRHTLVGGDIIEDFFQATGLPIAALPHRVQPRNQTLDAASAEFLRLYNIACLTPPHTPHTARRRALARILEQLSTGLPMAPPPDAVRDIEARFAADNAVLARRFLGRETLFEASPALQGFSTEPTSKALAQIAAAVRQATQLPLDDDLPKHPPDPS